MDVFTRLANDQKGTDTMSDQCEICGKDLPDGSEFKVWQDVVSNYDRTLHIIQVRYPREFFGRRTPVLFGAFLDSTWPEDTRLYIPATHRTVPFSKEDIIRGLNGEVLTVPGKETNNAIRG